MAHEAAPLQKMLFGLEMGTMEVCRYLGIHCEELVRMLW